MVRFSKFLKYIQYIYSMFTLQLGKNCPIFRPLLKVAVNGTHQCEKCGSCWLKEQMCDANTKTADSFSKIRVLAAGVITLPIFGESNNTHVWSFWRISIVIMHCLGWQCNDPWVAANSTPFEMLYPQPSTTQFDPQSFGRFDSWIGRGESGSRFYLWTLTLWKNEGF